MTEAPPRPLARHSRSGVVAEVAGIFGIVLCVLAIVGLWLGRGWLSDRADAFTVAAEHATAHAMALADTAVTETEARAQEVDAIEAAALEVAGDPTATSEALQALVSRLTPVADAYGTTRDTYVSLREGIGAALDTVQRLDRFVRQVDIPDDLGASLSGIDARLVAIDTALSGVVQAGAATTSVSAGATALANQAAALSDALRAAEDVARAAHAGLADVQTQLVSAAATVDELVGYSAIALTVFLTWVLLLNLALWALGRRWRAA